MELRRDGEQWTITMNREEAASLRLLARNTKNRGASSFGPTANAWLDQMLGGLPKSPVKDD